MARKKEVKEAVSEVAKSSFDVYDGNFLIRTYSTEIHGENAGELAKQFAEKNNYRVA